MLLHISNNYISSKVHKNLILSLSKYIDESQEVYIPIRNPSHYGVNTITEVNNVNLIYSHCLMRLMRFFPFFKVLRVTFDCLLSLEGRFLNGDNTIIAHTLWSDGAVAYLLSLIKGADYILIVRNTDINLFLPKLMHYRFLIKLIIKRSKALVFISHAHKRRFANTYPEIYRYSENTYTIPNGIEEFWFKNHTTIRHHRDNSIIFVGKFEKNKNLPAIVNSALLLRKKDINVNLTMVGGTLEEFVKLTGLKSIPDWITVLEHVEKERLIELYRSSCVFIMPSFHETFGLVYIEALSQGCSLIYTKGEGVDGYFNDCDFAIGVDPSDWQSISFSIAYLLNKYPDGISDDMFIDILNQFSWDDVAKKYLGILTN
jgi:L-malate glycosyltransferase